MYLLILACTSMIILVIHTYVYPVKNDVDMLKQELINDNYISDDDIAKYF